MSTGLPPIDPRWHRLLGLAVHEFRTPVTVVAGYIRMLLTGRAGELTEQQRRLLTEAEKSCGRLSGLLGEMSDLASLEAGTASFNQSRVDVGGLIQETIASVPPLPDREVTITLTNEAYGATVPGDPVRLKAAFGAVFTALRRELVTSTQLLVRLGRATQGQRPVVRVSVADEEHIDAVDRSEPSELSVFNEWRGGCGLSLAVARRIITGHDGHLWSPEQDPKSGAVIMLPEA
jgi:signal transduction histidine kinase